MSLFNNKTKMSIEEATEYMTEEFGIENYNIEPELWEKIIKNIFANINIENESHSIEDWYKLYLYRIKDNTMLQILQNQNLSNKLDQLIDIELKRLELEKSIYNETLTNNTIAVENNTEEDEDEPEM